MILGMSIANFTVLHVAISIVAIFAGVAVLAGMAKGRLFKVWNEIFLVTTILTSVTGFMFPFVKFGPPHVFGIITLAAMVPGLYALYAKRLGGFWRYVYIGVAWLTFYLNFVVLIVQSFQKIPALNIHAPTQAEPPFLVAQVVVLGLFVVSGVLAVRRFRPVAA